MSSGFTHIGAGISNQTMPNQQAYYPSAYSFSNEQANAKLTFYADNDNLDKAEQTLALFNRHGFRPSLVNYTKMINAYGRSGRLDAAFNIFQTMQRNGMKPTTFQYNALMHQCLQNGQEGRVFNLFHEMRQNWVMPNKITHIHLISANVNLRNMTRARQIFRDYIGMPNASMRSGKPHVDCHGLSPQAAFVQLTEFLSSHHGEPFSVIVGQGLHSKGKFQMKEYMLEKLKGSNYLDVTVRQDNPGILDVSFSDIA
ncbi:hypothetical protein [Simkania sp.]|uniref:hypothetical protein n=1 Tax=Simkania sp. TaxID=34094 RepID=UPI003B517544